MTPKRACLSCRIRKVKCIPATPRCVRCTELKIDECFYLSAKKRGTGNVLGTGEACQRCRKRKRRCDAKQPCTACVQLGVGSDCTYEQNRTKRMREKLPAEAQHFLFSFKCTPHSPDSSPSRATNEDPPFSAFDAPSPECTNPASVSTHRTSFHISPRGPRTTESNASEESNSPFPRKTSNTETQLVPFQENSPKLQLDEISPFSPSLQLSRVPHPLPLSFPLLNPECFQVSGTTSSELDLSFRIAGLLRLRLFGIQLTNAKQEAVLRGDTSDTVVHPFFIHAAAGIGMQFRVNATGSLETIQLRVKNGQLAFEQAAEISKGCDAYLKAQAFLQIATGGLYGNWFDLCRQYLTKACLALNAAKLQFVPTSGCPQKLTEDDFEKFAILSQNIYFENYMFLAVDGVEPRMTARIEREFRHELERAYPQLFQICPLTMRTQAILLVKDVILIMSLSSADGTKPTRWRQTRDEVVTQLHEYSDTLLWNIQKFVEIGDSHGTEIIQSSCVGCLAHLAVLCDFVGRLEPNSKSQMDTICDWSLERLGELTQGVSFDEYTHLDLFLKISWERSLLVFDSRIDDLSEEESASLRRHREVVAEAWSGFKAKLPNEASTSITALLVSVDGRQEGSKYPNFMLASERWTYGL